MMTTLCSMVSLRSVVVFYYYWGGSAASGYLLHGHLAAHSEVVGQPTRKCGGL